MIDFDFSHLPLILEESHEFVDLVVVLRNVLHVYTVFSLSFLPSWLFIEFVTVLRRTGVWFGHLIDGRRLSYWMIHRFSFGRRWWRWNEGLASEEQRSSKERL